MEKELEQPEIRINGRDILVVIDGKHQTKTMFPGDRLAGEDVFGVKLQIEAKGYAYKWRFFRETEDKWSSWVETFFAPTEKINDLDPNAPTIALVAQEQGYLIKKLPYGVQWKRNNNRGKRKASRKHSS